ncbi:MAG: hypothetical protein A2107_05485 [Verrucomicrobia bacterium GWF2_62_7]|nr:MAG: hypothetical protein A2107_05485 [Verrucomicrobia bacterium GWF2_62_7]
MKRPIGLYFVAVWCCLVLWVETNFICALLRHYQNLGDCWFRMLMLAATILAAWLAVGLLRFKPFERWPFIAVLAFSTTALGYRLGNPPSPSSLYYANTTTFARCMHDLVIITIITLNILSIWYLSRRSFREFARQFVEERQKQKAGIAKNA